MGIVVKLTEALRNVLEVVEAGDTSCRCSENHMCRICEAKAVLQETEQIIASGSSEGLRPRRKIYCITTDRMFDSLKEASEYYNIVPATISKACKGQLRYGGKFGGQKLEWKYGDEDVGKV